MAKSRYFDKLRVLGLAPTDDPYASGDFQNQTTHATRTLHLSELEATCTAFAVRERKGE